MSAWHDGKWYSTIFSQVREPLPEEVEEKCGRFFCERINQAACCRSCPRFMSCDRACLNDPERCGLAAEN
jgi:hypothetical protein